jgi:hypothetical protein
MERGQIIEGDHDVCHCSFVLFLISSHMLNDVNVPNQMWFVHCIASCLRTLNTQHSTRAAVSASRQNHGTKSVDSYLAQFKKGLILQHHSRPRFRNETAPFDAEVNLRYIHISLLSRLSCCSWFLLFCIHGPKRRQICPFFVPEIMWLDQNWWWCGSNAVYLLECLAICLLSELLKCSRWLKLNALSCNKNWIRKCRELKWARESERARNLQAQVGLLSPGPSKWKTW